MEEEIQLDSDPRLAWLRAKTCAALGCESEDFEPLLKSQENKDQLIQFLEGGRADASNLIIWVLRWTVLYQNYATF
jgi:hypothetical protein